ncbi:MAG: MerR family transcriptional regulator [Xanthomonadales bacterium]|jgi:DNA-binding transcriptional MerR regulator/methylmalonyl-CoA mutase cobalamin-binding subunit|nr:MerR family transcriptional regulator [Xanthomonadales bacterium]
MVKAVPIIDDTSVGLFPIRTVAQLTGVNAITLRAWENRYGIIKPLRKASGHRLYTQDHIDRVHRIVALLDTGMRISDVSAYLEQEAGRIETGGKDGSVDHWRRLLDRMLAAIMRFDEESLESVYNEALSSYPIKEVTRRLVTPLLVEIGRRWSTGEGTVAEEHFFGFYLRNKLGARFHHRSRNARGPRLLMACLPGERHEIGLLLLALATNEAGYRPVILGADMPLEDLAQAAERTGSAAIVLSGLLELPPHLLKKELPALVDAAEMPVFMGGRASVRSLDAVRRCGIEPLGADVDTGLAKLEQRVPLEA